MNKFMMEAIKEANTGIKLGHGGPFGCVIVKDGKIIARGHNCVVSKNDVTAHGEMEAIRKACKKLKSFDLTGCVVYTSGYPCPMCMAACQWANIEKIYYGCSLEDTNKLGFRDDQFYKNKLKPIELDREQCLEVYKAYSQMENKKHY